MAGSFRPRPVVIMSPFPPAECGRRLEAVTARSQMAGYLGSIFTARPRPRLCGRVTPARVQVSRLPQGEGGLRFDGTIEQAPDGGTILRGTVGPPPMHLPFALVILAAWSLIIPIALAAGISFLIEGHPHQALPDLLVPGIMLAVVVIIVVFTPRAIRSETRRLLKELSEVLGSTATMEP